MIRADKNDAFGSEALALREPFELLGWQVRDSAHRRTRVTEVQVGVPSLHIWDFLKTPSTDSK